MLAQLETITGRKARHGLFVIDMEYGRNFSGPDKDVFFYDRSVGHTEDAWRSNFLHPVVYYYRHLPTGELGRGSPPSADILPGAGRCSDPRSLSRHTCHLPHNFSRLAEDSEELHPETQRGRRSGNKKQCSQIRAHTMTGAGHTWSVVTPSRRHTSKRDSLAVCVRRRANVEGEGTWRRTLRGTGERPWRWLPQAGSLKSTEKLGSVLGLCFPCSGA